MRELIENENYSDLPLERLFEYCWVNRGKQFKDDWENLIHHGILNPLSFLLNKAFYENEAS
ncbi:MAG: hypothetical protein CAF41_003305 [Nitrospira sp. CG24A]|nr:MAG: hypothetical protein CAF41_003305 [Nitrospira sp. CG24A]